MSRGHTHSSGNPPPLEVLDVVSGLYTRHTLQVAASFLVEHLRVDWVKGAAWFHTTLVDADAAINPMMWQNAGRSGVDQWNFVMSPENASQDPSGSYVRAWVPELAKLPNKYACGVDIGQDESYSRTHRETLLDARRGNTT